jgi:hypothetical protein
MNKEEIIEKIGSIEDRIVGIFYYLEQHQHTFDPVVEEIYAKYNSLNLQTRGEIGYEETLKRLIVVLERMRSRAEELGLKLEDMTDEKLKGYLAISDAEFEKQREEASKISDPHERIVNHIFKKPGIH